MKTKLTDSTVTNLLSGMTRDELRSLAKHFGLKTGKSRKDTEANLAAAVKGERFKFTAVVQIKTVPDSTSKYGNMVYSRKVRNLTGKEDKVLFPLANVAAPTVDGEPQGE